MPTAEPTRVVKERKATTKPKVFVEKKDRPVKLVKQLQNEYVGKTITRKMLDTTVQITIRELIAVTPEVQKMLTKALTKEEAFEFRLPEAPTVTAAPLEILVEDREHPVPHPAPRDTTWYAMASPMVTVVLGFQLKLKARK